MKVDVYVPRRGKSVSTLGVFWHGIDICAIDISLSATLEELC